MIETITRDEAMKLVRKWHSSPRRKGDKMAVSARLVPYGRYLFMERDGQVGALDNSRGRCRVESFESLIEAAQWMKDAKDEEE